MGGPISGTGNKPVLPVLLCHDTWEVRWRRLVPVAIDPPGVVFPVRGKVPQVLLRGDDPEGALEPGSHVRNMADPERMLGVGREPGGEGQGGLQVPLEPG